MKAWAGRRAVVVAALAALAAAGPVADAGLRAAAEQPDAAEALLARARVAATEHDFTGVLEVRWSDRSGPRTQEVSIRSTNGVLALGDDGRVVVDGADRFVHASEGWLAVWHSAPGRGAPSPSEKWSLTLHDGPTVATILVCLIGGQSRLGGGQPRLRGFRQT